MQFRDLLAPELVICNDEKITNKKQALQCISSLLIEANNQLRYQNIYNALAHRERLGTTALGHGVAIPHARVQDLEQPLCVLITLKKAINFDADDAVAVDIIFGLLVPEDANQIHLDLLASIAQALREPTFREQLRQTQDADSLFRLAVSNMNQQADLLTMA